MTPYQKFLVEKYGVNDEPSTTQKELFFDIECEIGGALTEEYIEDTLPITSIAWWDKKADEWAIIILDRKNQLKNTQSKNQKIIACNTEKELLTRFVGIVRDIDPDRIPILCGDYFDIPYLYYRMCNVLGQDVAKYLSPIGYVRETPWYKDQ